jgi:calcineurin-like phosphoesterase family protein
MRYFFTADEHYGHRNIIRYCDRPFESVDEMNAELIRRHKAVVGRGDIVVHAGDFTLGTPRHAHEIMEQLRGDHVFLRGSHDKWMKRPAPDIWQKTIEGQLVVVCHYAMRVWPASHYNSWQLFGHSHGQLPPEGKQWDVGVDNNDFAPVSFEQLVAIMSERPDNFNRVKPRDKAPRG